MSLSGESALDTGELDFVMDRDDDSDPTSSAHASGIFVQLSALAVLAYSATMTVAGEFPLWIQPTHVGALWGGSFFAGFACGSFGRGSYLWAIWAAAVVSLSSVAFCRLSSFGAFDSILLSACILTLAWIAASLGSRNWSMFPHRWWVGLGKSTTQFSIWDMAFLTCIVAMICASVSRLEARPVLLASVFLALTGGLCSCWVACQWVWHDCWSIWKVFFLVVSVLVALSTGVVFMLTTNFNASILDTVQWLLTGPINVIAAQATTVLALSALVRLDQSFATSPTVNSGSARTHVVAT